MLNNLKKKMEYVSARKATIPFFIQRGSNWPTHI